jgi:hypothetical protein
VCSSYLNDEKVNYDVHANSDDEARAELRKALRATPLVYGKKYVGRDKYELIPLGGLGWKVSTLVEEGETDNLWNEPRTQSGGRKRLTKEKVVVNKKEKTVYVGPRGGRYVRANGKFVHV